MKGSLSLLWAQFAMLGARVAALFISLHQSSQTYQYRKRYSPGAASAGRPGALAKPLPDPVAERTEHHSYIDMHASCRFINA